MPVLADVARASICVPRLSVHSERVLSKYGQLANKGRVSLKRRKLDILIFLTKNYSYQYSSE